MLSIMHTTEFEKVVRHGERRIMQKLICTLDYNNSIDTSSTETKRKTFFPRLFIGREKPK